MRILKMNYFLSFLLLVVNFWGLNAQNATVKGYIFEDSNRGYLNMALIEVIDPATSHVFEKVYSNIEGYFTVNVPAGIPLKLSISKEMFETVSEDINLGIDIRKDISVKMKRTPGYVFEVTLAEKRDSVTATARAITGAKLEVYNNTAKKMVLNEESLESPEFKLNFLKGNHYTIMLRKPGYLTKRLEAYVNVKGCILCFDGVGDVRPGVVDNLSGNNEIGVLLANVEMERVEVDKVFELRNLYYEIGKSTLTKDSQKELDNLASIAINNPQITFEVGSHTDSRGDAQLNWDLSDKRSKSVVDYLVKTKDVSPKQIVAKGYGEYHPVNKCRDGVICSEVDHAANRRTELKVLSIDDQFIPKSLEQIITIEDFEKTLLQEQVKVVQVPSTDSVKVSQGSSMIIQGKAEQVEVTDRSVKPMSTTKAVLESNFEIAATLTKETEEVSPQTIDNQWIVRAGIFANLANAQSTLDRVFLLGYPKVSILPNDKLYVVVVGQFKTKEEALDVVTDLTKNGVDSIADSLIADQHK